MQAAQRKIDYDRAPNPATKRVVKMRGNVAYINNDFLAEHRKNTHHSVGAEHKSKPVVKVNQKAKPVPSAGRGIVSTLFVVFVAFCALALLVSRHAAITAIGVENNVIQKDIAVLEAKIDELSLDIELKSTVVSVQNSARELGMTYPINNQRSKIDING